MANNNLLMAGTNSVHVYLFFSKEIWNILHEAVLFSESQTA